MKVAVIGANGQLGSDVVEQYQKSGDEPVSLTHHDIDIASLDAVRRVLAGIQPSLIINTAAMHHVENCEANPLRAYEVNALGARNLAIVARDVDAKLVHISTDYVFDGGKRQAYLESDPAVPLNVYGNTKLAGEAFIRASWPAHFILRTSALYGKLPCRAKGGLNFVELMLKLAAERPEIKVVDDEIVSPTFTVELARQIVALSRTEEFGLYHATAEGSCSWYRFACEIFEATGTRANLRIASPTDFPAKVPRPKYSVLENHGLKRLGLNLFQTWQNGVHDYLSAKGQSRKQVTVS